MISYCFFLCICVFLWFAVLCICLCVFGGLFVYMPFVFPYVCFSVLVCFLCSCLYGFGVHSRFVLAVFVFFAVLMFCCCFGCLVVVFCVGFCLIDYYIFCSSCLLLCFAMVRVSCFVSIVFVFFVLIRFVLVCDFCFCFVYVPCFDLVVFVSFLLLVFLMCIGCS